MPLSIIESLITRATTTGVWFYQDIDQIRLLNSLQDTVDVVPFWCGRLKFLDYVPNGSVYQRYMHAEVLYNYEDDKGVRLDVVESDENFDEILKATETDILDVYKPLDVVQFLAVLGQYQPITDTSCLSIKITTFSCGIIAIGANASHALADALVLQQF